jgi:hypothetical protein
MAITDRTILNQIQILTVENTGDLGATWPSGQWTKTEVLGYLNQRQNRFLAETGLMWTRLETAITIAQLAQANPTNWITTIFVAHKSSAGVYRELPKMDVTELDYAISGWPGTSAASPRGYYEIDGVTATTFVAPIPTDAGSALERYYVALGTTMDQSGINFSVPDEFVPTIKWGTLADMFGKLGEGTNFELGQACEERWEEGLEIGKLMAEEGWFVL